MDCSCINISANILLYISTILLLNMNDLQCKTKYTLQIDSIIFIIS